MNKTKFEDYAIGKDILKALEILKFKNPTDVQSKVMPVILDNKDVVVKSQTGSGKTGAFAIPLCNLVDWDENKPQALVLTPTRELAIQVKEDIFNIGRFKRIKVAAVYGKSPINRQIKELKQKTHIVVGTPGRLIDHIERGTIDLSEVKYLVLDEADEMLNMGFLEQVEKIIKDIKQDKITILLSATMPGDIERLSRRYMKSPVHIEMEEQDSVADRITQIRYSVIANEKLDLLKDIITVQNPDSCMIFCNTRQKVDEVYKVLDRMDCRVDKIHGGMEQDSRLRVMNDFRLGYFRYLVATDVAARGIDIEDISLVINYDIPQDPEVYVHRIGRTGRKSKKGKALTFVSQGETKFSRDIQKYIKMEISLEDRPSEERVAEAKQDFIDKISARPKIKKTKGSNLNKEILKLHINAGKKTKMRPVDIVGTLCNIDGMTADDIGIINILDISTFVEILNNKGDMVYKVLQNKPIKGRIRKVSKADR